MELCIRKEHDTQCSVHHALCDKPSKDFAKLQNESECKGTSGCEKHENTKVKVKGGVLSVFLAGIIHET